MSANNSSNRTFPYHREMLQVSRPPESSDQEFRILSAREEDRRWLAEVPELPGVMAYGTTKKDAEVSVTTLALPVIADRT